MTYGLVFWGNSCHSNIILGYKRMLSELLWELEIEDHVENILEN
jgi:hypothetical protein